MDECNFSEDLIFQYIRGELSSADEELFELHYLECDVCLDKVVFLRSLGKVLEQKRPLVVKMVIKNYFKKLSEFMGEFNAGLKNTMQAGFYTTKLRTEKTIFEINLSDIPLEKLDLVSEIKDSEKEFVLKLKPSANPALIDADAFILIVSRAVLRELWGSHLKDETIEHKLQKVFLKAEFRGEPMKMLQEQCFKLDGKFEKTDKFPLSFKCEWTADEYAKFLEAENELIFVIF